MFNNCLPQSPAFQLLLVKFSESTNIFKSCQMAKSMLGDWGRKEIVHFWEHLMAFDEWSKHPVLNDVTVDKGRKCLSCSFKTQDIKFARCTSLHRCSLRWKNLGIYIYTYIYCSLFSISFGFGISNKKWASELYYPGGQNGQGLIPTTFHVDGVEFFTNAEYVCWSMSSTLAAGNVSKLGDEKLIASFKIWKRHKWISLVCIPAGKLVFKVWDYKYPLVIIPGASMRKRHAARPLQKWQYKMGLSYLWHKPQTNIDSKVSRCPAECDDMLFIRCI